MNADTGPGRAEIVRHMLVVDWNNGDIDALLEHLTEDCEWHPLVVTAIEGEGEPFRGHDGFREFYDAWTSTWDTWNLEIEEFREYGDQVLALTRVHAKGRGSGVEIDQEMAHLFEFRGDLVWRGQSFLQRDAAVAFAESRAAAETAG